MNQQGGIRVLPKAILTLGCLTINLVHTKCAIYYLSAPKWPFIACSMKTDLDPSHMIFLLAATLLNFLSRGHKWDRKSGKGFISSSQLLCFCTFPTLPSVFPAWLIFHSPPNNNTTCFRPLKHPYSWTHNHKPTIVCTLNNSFLPAWWLWPGSGLSNPEKFSTIQWATTTLSPKISKPYLRRAPASQF